MANTTQRRKDNKNRVLKEGEYQRKNGTYEYRWVNRLGEAKSIYAKSLNELRKKEDYVNKNILNMTDLQNDNISLDNLFDMWYKNKMGIKEHTKILYLNEYRLYIKNALGGYKIKNIKNMDIKNLYINLLQKIDFGLLKGVNSLLNQLFEFAIDNEMLNKNPCKNCANEIMKQQKLNTIKDTKIKSLNAEQQKAFEDFLKKDKRANKSYNIIITLLYTGMCIGEIAGLEVKDINFDTYTINVKNNLLYYRPLNKEKYEYVIETTKNRYRTRQIPMLDIVKTCITNELKIRKEKKISKDNIGDFLFLNSAGKPFTSEMLNKRLYAIVSDYNNNAEKANLIKLPHISCHTLRHTFATRMCENNVNIKTAQKVLGHNKIETTMNIYVHSHDDFIREELFKMQV